MARFSLHNIDISQQKTWFLFAAVSTIADDRGRAVILGARGSFLRGNAFLHTWFYSWPQIFSENEMRFFNCDPPMIGVPQGLYPPYVLMTIFYFYPII